MTLAEENGLHSYYSVCKMLNCDIDRLLQMSEVDLRLLLMGELRTDGLRTRRYIAANISLPAPLGLWSRVCPVCLSSGLPVHEFFNYALTVVCSRHQLHLVDHCDRCNKRLLYTRRRRLFCDCGFDLRASRQYPAEGWVPLFYGTFAPWRGGISEQFLAPGLHELERHSGGVLRALLGQGGALECRVSTRDHAVIRSFVQKGPNDLQMAIANRFTWVPVRMRERLMMNLSMVDLPVVRSAVKFVESQVPTAMAQNGHSTF